MSTPSPEPPASGRERLLRSAIGHFAKHGIGDASLRQIAGNIGSSHRMLIYHFQTRDGLLEAVVEELEKGERDILRNMLIDDGRPTRVRSWEFWTHVVDVVDFYGTLYFELASRAMQSGDLQNPLRIPNVEMWIDAMATFWKRQGGLASRQARVQARLSLAVARGLLHDFLLTRDRRAVDQAMTMYDWLCFQTPHPEKQVARTTRSWRLPSPDGEPVGGAGHHSR